MVEIDGRFPTGGNAVGRGDRHNGELDDTLLSHRDAASALTVQAIPWLPGISINVAFIVGAGVNPQAAVGRVTSRVRDVLARPTHIRKATRPASGDRKSTRLNSSHGYISYAVFCLKKK